MTIVFTAALFGLTAGGWLGERLVRLYGSFFAFPNFGYRLELRTATIAVLASVFSGSVGALYSVRKVARLPPAEAMRPPAPIRYRRTLVERLGLFSYFSPSARMVLREVQRRPVRTLLSSLGLSMAVAILVVGRFGVDAVSSLLETQFHHAMREDLNVTFAKPAAARAEYELRGLPGVIQTGGNAVGCGANASRTSRARSGHHGVSGVATTSAAAR